MDEPSATRTIRVESRFLHAFSATLKDVVAGRVVFDSLKRSMECLDSVQGWVLADPSARDRVVHLERCRVEYNSIQVSLQELSPYMVSAAESV
ncbi:MAG TPA: hypothetical protein VJB87_03855 [Candidatus Nanoarchaeia archaeon]|nr:hypothetical protein [Candidatus Nanoarchaeia archaeon]